MQRAELIWNTAARHSVAGRGLKFDFLVVASKLMVTLAPGGESPLQPLRS
jgi:hypothetical protein